MSLIRNLFLFVAICTAFSAPAATQTAPNPQAVFSVLPGLGVNSSLESVASRPGTDFEPLDPGKNYPLDAQHVLWLRVQVQVEADDLAAGNSYVLDFPQPYINAITVYTPQAGGGWQTRIAGNTIDHANWPINSLSPQFKLAGLTVGSHTVFAKIVHGLPLRLGVEVLSADEAQSGNQNELLQQGLILGCIALMAVLGGIMAFTFRNRIYAWYCAFASLMFFSLASYSGVAAYAFWPDSPVWTAVSTLVFLLAGSVTQVLFCRRMFFDPQMERWLRWLVPIEVIGTVLAIAVYVITAAVGIHFGKILGIGFFNFWIVLTFCTALAIVLWAYWRKQPAASMWLIAYTPLIIASGLSQLSLFGIVAMPWLPYNLPAYCLIFEVVVVMFTLNKHAKQTVVVQTSETIKAASDPLTGFMAAHMYQEQLSNAWLEAQTKDADMSLALVTYAHDAALRWQGHEPTPQAQALRVVRLIKTVMRPQDIVVQRDARTLAIIMPGLSAGDGLEGRLARLVALGLMADTHDKANEPPIRFRIAAATKRLFHEDEYAFDTAVQLKLNDFNGAAASPIVYLQPQIEDMNSFTELDELWARALDETPDPEKPVKTKPVGLAQP